MLIVLKDKVEKKTYYLKIKVNLKISIKIKLNFAKIEILYIRKSLTFLKM